MAGPAPAACGPYTDGRMTTRSRPTSFDIAYRAGVSQATVSRVLRGGARVSDETRRRVEAAVRELDYRVDRRASGLRTRTSGLLALLLFEAPTGDGASVDPVFLAMLGPISRACAAHGRELLVAVRQQADGWDVDYGDPVRADGLILLGDGGDRAARERRAALARRGIRLVCQGAAPIEDAAAVGARLVDDLMRQVRGDASPWPGAPGASGDRTAESPGSA